MKLAVTSVWFNRPYATGSEFAYIQEAIAEGQLSSGGRFCERCAEWLCAEVGCDKAYLTPSGTAALEMAALLGHIRPGDEVVMPSFTFVSTANAFVLRGAVPVFVDIRPDTLNLDERLLEAAITSRTKAIVPVHYAGVACEMDVISALAAERDLLLVEDAAHGLGATYRGRALGSLGDLASISFHETKNVICGEGGALTVNSPAWVKRADVVYEKGTDRSAFLAGEVDKYTWRDTGSSFGMSELSAAFLWAQLESASEITRERMRIWRAYHEAFGDLEKRGWARRPIVPPHCEHNAHMYYLLLEERDRRDHFIEQLERRGVQTVFHYVPLHTSPAGRRYGRVVDGLEVTERTSEALVRLPLWVGMEGPEIERVIDAVHEALGQAGNKAPARRGRGRATGEHSPAESLEQA